MENYIFVQPQSENLEDITLRVLRTLKEVDLIAAEDTRNSIKTAESILKSKHR